MSVGGSAKSDRHFLLDLTGIPSSCFMLLYGIVWVSLILLYVTEIRRIRVIGSRRETAEGIGSS